MFCWKSSVYDFRIWCIFSPLFHKTSGLVKESEILEIRPYLFLLVNITGQRFALREGGRTVGAGVVSKALSWVDAAWFFSFSVSFAGGKRKTWLLSLGFGYTCHVVITFHSPQLMKYLLYLGITREISSGMKLSKLKGSWSSLFLFAVHNWSKWSWSLLKQFCPCY